MNATDTTAWTSADTIQIVNLFLTSFIAILTLHQSWKHRHLESKCCGDTCCLVIESSEEERPAAEN